MRVSIALCGLQTCRLGVYFVKAMALDGFFRETGWLAILIGCSGRLGFCSIFKPFPHLSRILLSSRVHARPHAANAGRWCAKESLAFFAG
jgi:hypothetical protein